MMGYGVVGGSLRGVGGSSDIVRLVGRCDAAFVTKIQQIDF